MPEVVVIGAGFGGLAAALTLADAGAKVTLCEQLKYPGGCASTFRRAGCAFEAGATLFSGFGQDQLFGRWIERFELPVRFQTLNPVIHFRSPALCLDVPATKERFVAALCALEGAPVRALQ